MILSLIELVYYCKKSTLGFKNYLHYLVAININKTEFNHETKRILSKRPNLLSETIMLKVNDMSEKNPREHTKYKSERISAQSIIKDSNI